MAQGPILGFVIRDWRRYSGVGPTWGRQTGLERVFPACKAGVLTR
jgi:hypothetical protein